jgi:hypothetical protein
MNSIHTGFKICALALALFVVGCTHAPKGGMNEMITLESLMDNSNEKVSVDLTSPHNMQDVEQWLSSEAPASATLYCFPDSHHCAKVGALLSKASVPHEYQALHNAKATPHVDLFYDRMISLDCDTLRFGCALASNELKMMSDRRQIITPLISNGTDADHAVKAIGRTMGQR